MGAGVLFLDCVCFVTHLFLLFLGVLVHLSHRPPDLGGPLGVRRPLHGKHCPKPSDPTRLHWTPPPRGGDEPSSPTVRTCLEPKPVAVFASQGAAFGVCVCVWFLRCRLRLFVCLFRVAPTPIPRWLGWVGFILSAPPWPPSAPPRTPNVCWPFPFQIPTINSCVCVGGGGEKIPRKRFLFGETEKGREREREGG